MKGRDIEPHMVPINGDAARVVYGEMVHFEPSHVFSNAFVNKPELLTDERTLRKLLRDPRARNVIASRLNKKFGRITVLGLAKDQGPKNSRTSRGMLWVCRCDCGMYCHIRNRTFIQETNIKCGHCKYSEYLRHAKKEQCFVSYKVETSQMDKGRK